MRHVPAVERSADMAHVSGASGTLAPRRKGHVPTARKGRGGGERGRSAIRRPCAAGAARRRCRATGGIATEPCKPHSRMDAVRGMEGGCALAERDGAPQRSAPVPTVAKNAPASRAAPCRGGGSLSGRTRRQSRDCRAVRDATRGAPLRGGKRGWRVLRHTMTGTARTAQSSPRRQTGGNSSATEKVSARSGPCQKCF